MGLEDEIWMVDFLRAVIVFMFAAWFVDSCNCISIMWSPSLIVRLRGAAPERKSFTCKRKKLSEICLRRKTANVWYEFEQDMVLDRLVQFFEDSQRSASTLGPKLPH